MYDSMSAEVEVLDFLKAIVKTLKPEVVVETGTFSGLEHAADCGGVEGERRRAGDYVRVRSEGVCGGEGEV